MKTGLIGPAYPLRGGIANFNEALYKALLVRGLDVEVISFSLQYPSLLFPGKTQFEKFELPPEIKIIKLISSINPFTWLKTAKYIIRSDFQFLVFQYWMPFMAPAMGSIVRLVKRKCPDIKVVAVMHNVVPHESFFANKWLLKYFSSVCDGFLALSHAVLNDISIYQPNAIAKLANHPIYNIYGPKVGKYEAIQYLNLDPAQRHLLFFGIIREYKGLDLLLEALSKDPVRILDVKLIVAGEFYENKEKYLKIIKKYNLEENVILTDFFIPREEIKYYFAAADLVVQPYHSATQSGITQIAYHFERPMLVTDVGGLSEIVPNRKCGYVTPVSADAIAHVINDFYMHNREAGFAKNVQKEKGKFSWDSFVEALLLLYRELDEKVKDKKVKS